MNKLLNMNDCGLPHLYRLIFSKNNSLQAIVHYFNQSIKIGILFIYHRGPLKIYIQQPFW